MAQETVPYGSWKSPITTDLILEKAVGLGTPFVADGALYWTESRPQEKGRIAIVRYEKGKYRDLLPTEYNARTTVHEYGGKSITTTGDTLFFSNFDDQRIYRLTSQGEITPITSKGPFSYADGEVHPNGQWLYAVREDHSKEGEPQNTLVRIALDGKEDTGTIVASGNDFYSSPRINSQGTHLCYVTWNHPNMPWEGTQLWVAKIDSDGNTHSPQKVAGGDEESIVDPSWAPDGTLVYVSDKTDWYNLYRWDGKQHKALFPKKVEFAYPAWVFARPLYTFYNDSIACIYHEEGIHQLGLLDKDGNYEEISTPFSVISGITAWNGTLLITGSSPDKPTAILQIDPSTLAHTTIKESQKIDIDPSFFSIPKSIHFPAKDGSTAYAWYYPPQSGSQIAPLDEKPPVLVKSHGGPTSQSFANFNLAIQYWTSRGFAVLDVNYGGSTGYGRPYWKRLEKNWGIVDVDDCCSAAEYAAGQGWIDSKRMAIDGGSAGGYTTLSALTFRKTFQAGTSRYGVSDLEALAKETHKFESRYLDGLVGPYPAKRELYIQRSPIHHVDQICCPILLLQGLEDKVVPPNQSEKIFEALKKRGIPTAYITFENEQHGFRIAKNIKRSLEAEFDFYAQIFGFKPADKIEPVNIIRP